MIPKKFKTAYILSIIIIFLATIESAGGLLFPALFRDNALVVAALRGNDMVTLFLAVPLLLGALFVVRRGSARAELIWMAMLAYMVYNYAFYLFGSALNVFFLIYVALMALSIMALIFSLPQLDASAIAKKFNTRTPVRAIAVFMTLFALTLGSIWIIQTINFMITGQLPQTLTDFNKDTPVVFAIDLGVLIPFLLLGAGYLWRRRPWGYVLGVIMNVKSTTYALALIAMSWFANDFNLAATFDPLTIFFSLLGAGTLAASVALLANLRDSPSKRGSTAKKSPDRLHLV